MFNSTDPETDAVVAETPDDDPRPDGSELAMYNKEFDIEVGTTTVRDEVSDTRHSMWKATITGSNNPSVDMEGEVSYLGEHPADAVLGAIEKATGGVV